jgi:aminoglycoside phosphotransferase (APT) family kinase protein
MSGHNRPAQKMHADEVSVDDATVRVLLKEQFPHWADKSLVRFADSGTDSAIYRLGDDMGIRLPRIHWAEAQIEKECRWLSTLATGLSAPLPVPLARGRPGHGYPYPWLVYPWLEGTSLDQTAVKDWEFLAQDLGEFVLALEQLPTNDGPPPKQRGLPMAPFDQVVQWAIDHLEGIIDADRARRVWQGALDAGPWLHEPVWVHGDLLPGNILVRDGRLCGVIDWSGAGVGDPACEAMVAWSLPKPARRVFKRTLGFDEATWDRARGWVIQQTALYIPYYANTLPQAVDQAKARLNEALIDD